MGDFSKFIIKAFLRKALAVLGTYLLTRGILTDSEASGFVDAYLEELVGAALLGGSAAWTFFYQRYVKEKIVTALELPKGASTAALEAALKEKKEVN